MFKKNSITKGDSLELLRKIQDKSISKKLFDNGLCLPSGSNLSINDQIKVVEEIKSFFK